MVSYEMTIAHAYVCTRSASHWRVHLSMHRDVHSFVQEAYVHFVFCFFLLKLEAPGMIMLTALNILLFS
jgi:hypothetical protein